MRFDLIDLKLVLAIAESGSITGGAERSHMALASASARVKGLEDTLGTLLFERQRHGVTPTPAGRALIHHARTVVQQLEMMASELGDYAAGLRGRVRLLSNTTALVEHLPAALGEYLVAHPQVDLDIEEKPSHAIVHALVSRQAELGVLADSADMSGLECRPYRADPLYLITARGANANSSLAPLYFDEVLDHAFIGLDSHNPLQAHLAGKALKVGRHLNMRVRVNSFEAICSLVARGVGAAVIPLAALERSPSRGQLQATPLKDAWAMRTLHLCTLRFADLSPHALALADCILASGHNETETSTSCPTC